MKSASAYRWYVLAVLTFVYCTNIADRYVLSVLIEPIRAEFNLSDSALGFLSGFAFAIFYTAMGLPIALYADRGIRRNVVALAAGVYSVMTAVSGTAQSFLMLVLARIGVAAGEAGATPPSHSIISDLFPRSQRATALAIFSLGASLGLTLGMSGGGWIAERHGWRAAFLLMAVPGLLGAIVVRLTVREPERPVLSGQTDILAGLRESLHFMRGQRALLHVLTGGALINAYLVGLSVFLPSVMVRSHGYDVGTAGEMLGVILGVSGSFGLLAGGWLTDRLGALDLRWHCWLTALVTLLTLPPTIAMLYVDDSFLLIICVSAFGVANSLFLGPLFAMAQNLVQPQMRAFSAAVLLFAISILGMGLGPQLVGLLSDYINGATTYGEDSLRLALVALVGVTAPWSIFHYMRAALYLRGDYSLVE